MLPGGDAGHDRQVKRLLVYVDVPYRLDNGRFSTDRAFLKFVFALRSRFEEVVLVGRVRPGRTSYTVPADIDVVALPDYPTLRDVHRLLAVTPRALRILWREVARADAVLSIGPHPLSLPTALFSLLRRRRLVLMVRQNYPDYIRHRLPSPRWRPFVAVASAADGVFRTVSRLAPTVVVGGELAARYARSRRLLDLSVSLMPAEVHGTHEPRITSDAPRLLSVTRLDPEKSPLLLVEALARLNDLRGDRASRLTIAGTGPLGAELERLAEELAPGQVHLAGYVPHGDALFDLYRTHDVLVHTARTEGVPQVLVEALFVGIPVVATDVGGVRAAVADGRAALLVEPGDPAALAASVARLTEDESLRTQLVEAGLEHTQPLTLQDQADRLAAFIREA